MAVFATALSVATALSPVCQYRRKTGISTERWISTTPDGRIAATYDPFGNVIEKTGDADNDMLFAGYQYDPETGLYYLNSRMYLLVTARFLQEDTYTGVGSDPLSLNLYTYCYNSPLKYFGSDGT